MGELGFPYPRREIDNVTRRMFTHPLQHIDQVGVDVNALQFAGHDQALDDADLLRPELGPEGENQDTYVCRSRKLWVSYLFQAFVGIAFHVGAHRHPLFFVDEIDHQPSRLVRNFAPPFSTRWSDLA